MAVVRSTTASYSPNRPEPLSRSRHGRR